MRTLDLCVLTRWLVDPNDTLVARFVNGVYAPVPERGQQDDRTYLPGELWFFSRTLIFIPNDERKPVHVWPLAGMTHRTSATKRFSKKDYTAFAITFDKPGELITFRNDVATKVDKNVRYAPFQKFGVLKREEADVATAPILDLLKWFQDTSGAPSPGDAKKMQRQRFTSSCGRGATPSGSFSLKEEEVQMISNRWVLDGQLLVSDSELYFMPYSDPWHPFRISLCDVQRILPQETAGTRKRLEVFRHTGGSMLLQFASEQKAMAVAEGIFSKRGCRCSMATNAEFLEYACQQWVTGGISNFEYIEILNSYASRSYHDLEQYPVFPWVVADYTSRELDLTNPATFRDFTKPAGALNPDLLEALKAQAQHGHGEDPAGFLYRNFVSNFTTTVGLLLRDRPDMAASVDGGRLDISDRLFNSIPNMWKNLLSDKNDVRELTPEFFSGHGGFLVNHLQVPLSDRSGGRPADNVELPAWARDPADFVLKNREALECQLVGDALHSWIDLMFGALSRLPAAEEADNMYLATVIAQPRNAQDVEKLQVYGSLPTQLFTEPHPKKNPSWRSKMADLEDRVRNLEESAQQKSVEHDEMVRKFEAEMQDLQKKLEEETLNHMLALQSAPSPASGVAMVPPDTPLQRRNSVLEQTALWKARYEEVDRELTETRESLDVAVAKQQEAEQVAAAASSVLEDRETQIMQLQEEMEEMRSRLERKVATLRKRLSQVSDLKYIVKLEDDVKSLEKTERSLMDALRRTEVDNKQLSTRLDRTRTHKDKVEQMYISHRHKDGSFEEKRRTVEVLSEEVQRLRGELSSVAALKEDKEMEVRELREEVRRLDLTVHFLENKLSEQESKMTRLGVATSVGFGSPLPPRPAINTISRPVSAAGTPRQNSNAVSTPPSSARGAKSGGGDGGSRLPVLKPLIRPVVLHNGMDEEEDTSSSDEEAQEQHEIVVEEEVPEEVQAGAQGGEQSSHSGESSSSSSDEERGQEQQEAQEEQEEAMDSPQGPRQPVVRGEQAFEVQSKTVSGGQGTIVYDFSD